MELKQSRVFLVVTILLLAFLSSSSASSSASSARPSSIGFRVDLTHVDARKGYSQAELLRRAAERSKTRAAKLAGGFGPVTIHPSQGEYLLDLAIGTPPLYFTGILDTVSDLIWTQCQICMKCIPQPSPLFNPFRSPSFSILPCTHKLCRAVGVEGKSSCAPNCIYHYHYGDGTDSIGFMGTEILTFGTTNNKVHIPLLGFGCGLYNGGDLQNSSGVIGFGRGPISLVSQLGITTFSYCFTPQDDSTKSPLFVGSTARLTGPNVRTTPLTRVSPSIPVFSSFYHLSVKGITVGTTRVPIPPETFQVKKDGSGGMIIDSGTSFLQLDTAAYKPFINSFKSQIKALPLANTSLPFELCYGRLPARVPRLVFHLEDADWEMPLGNYIVHYSDIKLSCLVVQESLGLSVLGNVQTQNMHVLYDLRRRYYPSCRPNATSFDGG